MQITVEILDTTAQKHVLQCKDIASLTVSPSSIMPTGFESLPADDLKALLEYLSQGSVQNSPPQRSNSATVLAKERGL